MGKRYRMSLGIERGEGDSDIMPPHSRMPYPFH